MNLLHDSEYPEPGDREPDVTTWRGIGGCWMRQVGPLELLVCQEPDGWSWTVHDATGIQHHHPAKLESEAKAQAIECALAWALEQGEDDIVRQLSGELPRRAA